MQLGIDSWYKIKVYAWEEKISSSFSLFDSHPWFFPKTGLRVKINNFKIILTSSLGSLPVSRSNFEKWFLKDFGACSASQCTQNQI